MNRMWVFDSDVLSAGVASGIEVLRSAAGNLEILKMHPGHKEALRDLDAAMHLVSGIALTVGLADIQGAVCDVESAIERILDADRAPSHEELELLVEAVATLRALFLSIDGRTGSSRSNRHDDDLGRLRGYLTATKARSERPASLRVVASTPPNSSPL